MVNAALRPLSSIMAQLLIGSHMVPNSANPRVSHFPGALQMSPLVSKMATSWWIGLFSSLSLYKACHLQKRWRVSWAFEETTGPALIISFQYSAEKMTYSFLLEDDNFYNNNINGSLKWLMTIDRGHSREEGQNIVFDGEPVVIPHLLVRHDHNLDIVIPWVSSSSGPTIPH